MITTRTLNNPAHGLRHDKHVGNAIKEQLRSTSEGSMGEVSTRDRNLN